MGLRGKDGGQVVGGMTVKQESTRTEPAPGLLVRYGRISSILTRIGTNHAYVLELAFGPAGAVATKQDEEPEEVWRAVAFASPRARRLGQRTATPTDYGDPAVRWLNNLALLKPKELKEVAPLIEQVKAEARSMLTNATRSFEAESMKKDGGQAAIVAAKANLLRERDESGETPLHKRATLSLRDTALLLGIKPESVQRSFERKTLPGKKVNGRWFLDVRALREKNRERWQELLQDFTNRSELE